MDKFCIFCGKKPESKNLEHVIPQWLIELTGNPNRKAQFGIDFLKIEQRQFSFNQFKFPSCKKCNDEFSFLENETKTVVTSIVNEKPISKNAFSTFLTWLDKVRIGLWLGQIYLDKNIFGIKPNFYIKDRLNKKDRMVFIYRIKNKGMRLIFTGTNTAFFAFNPICFGLAINQFYIINVSTDFLFSRRLGLPFPPVIEQKTRERFLMALHPGLERILYPIIRFGYNPNCTEIYQPIIPEEIKKGYNHQYYRTEYSSKYFSSSRIGNIFIKVHDVPLRIYPAKKDSLWLPKILPRKEEADYNYIKTILKLHKHLLTKLPTLNKLSDELKEKFKKQYKEVTKFTNFYLKRFEDESKMDGKFHS